MKNLHESFFYDLDEKKSTKDSDNLESVSMSFEDYLIKSSSEDSIYVDKWVSSELSLSKQYFIKSLKG